jgi:hypothetical protein
LWILGILRLLYVLIGTLLRDPRESAPKVLFSSLDIIGLSVEIRKVSFNRGRCHLLLKEVRLIEEEDLKKKSSS